MNLPNFRPAAGLALGLAGLMLSACGLLVEKVPAADVDPAEQAIAARIGEDIEGRCATQRFTPLGDEATEEMRRALTPELQRSACASMRSMFGEFRGMSFVEMVKVRWRSDHVYRFKARFSATTETPEIRVVLSPQQKLSGIWVKPWSDELK